MGNPFKAVGKVVKDVVTAPSKVIDTITPWKDDTLLGGIATNLLLGGAVGGMGALAGLGMGTTMALGAGASLMYEMDVATRQRIDAIGSEAEAARRAAEERRAQLEQQRLEQLAIQRRASLADMALLGAIGQVSGRTELTRPTEGEDLYRMFEDTVNM